MFADEEIAIGVGSRDNEPLQVRKLVAAARSGSSTAFAELREIYARRVYRKLLIMTKNREDAEDALQDTFCAHTWRSIPSKKDQAFIPGLPGLRSTQR